MKMTVAVAEGGKQRPHLKALQGSAPGPQGLELPPGSCPENKKNTTKPNHSPLAASKGHKRPISIHQLRLNFNLYQLTVQLENVRRACTVLTGRTAPGAARGHAVTSHPCRGFPASHRTTGRTLPVGGVRMERVSNLSLCFGTSINFIAKSGFHLLCSNKCLPKH